MDIISDEEKKKIIHSEICKIEKCIRSSLSNKEIEIGENKLAFSAVARENTKVKKELVKKEQEIEHVKRELAECLVSIQQRDEDIENILEDKDKMRGR